MKKSFTHTLSHTHSAVHIRTSIHSQVPSYQLICHNASIPDLSHQNSELTGHHKIPENFKNYRDMTSGGSRLQQRGGVENTFLSFPPSVSLHPAPFSFPLISPITTDMCVLKLRTDGHHKIPENLTVQTPLNVNSSHQCCLLISTVL